MNAYSYDENGFYLGEVSQQPSPLEPGVFLVPAMATVKPPLVAGENQENRFANGEWLLVESRKSIADKLNLEKLRTEKEKADAEAARLAAEEAARIAYENSPEFLALKAKAILIEQAQARIDSLDVAAKLSGATTVAALRSAVQDVLIDLVTLRKK
jgi:hypothetical protein